MGKIRTRGLPFALLLSIAGLGCAGKKTLPPPPVAPAAATPSETGSAAKTAEPGPQGEAFVLEKTSAQGLGVRGGQWLESTDQPQEKLVGQPTYRSRHPLFQIVDAREKRVAKGHFECG